MSAGASPDPASSWDASADPLTWAERFATDTPFTVGIEEEVMLLAPATFDLAPESERVLRGPGDVDAFSPELHAAQIEVKTPPSTLPGAIEALRAARRRLVEAERGRLRIATCGVHPFAERMPPVSPGERYRRLAAEYGRSALEMVTFGLHVHVAVDGAERAVAIHDAVREHLPTLAALAANGPFHAGQDTGFASERPRLAEALPRQGVPPAFGDFATWAELVRWGQGSGAFGPQELWWEVRLHPIFGTVEIRVADAQAAMDDVGAVATVIAALVATLSDQFDAGTLPAPAASERISENRWRALRSGLDGDLLDPRTGEAIPAQHAASELLDLVAPAAERLDGVAGLARARELVQEGGGAARQREVAQARGLTGLVSWLADQYEAGT